MLLDLPTVLSLMQQKSGNLPSGFPIEHLSGTKNAGIDLSINASSNASKETPPPVEIASSTGHNSIFLRESDFMSVAKFHASFGNGRPNSFKPNCFSDPRLSAFRKKLLWLALLRI